MTKSQGGVCSSSSLLFSRERTPRRMYPRLRVAARRAGHCGLLTRLLLPDKEQKQKKQQKKHECNNHPEQLGVVRVTSSATDLSSSSSLFYFPLGLRDFRALVELRFPHSLPILSGLFNFELLTGKEGTVRVSTRSAAILHCTDHHDTKRYTHKNAKKIYKKKFSPGLQEMQDIFQSRSNAFLAFPSVATDNKRN